MARTRKSNLDPDVDVTTRKGAATTRSPTSRKDFGEARRGAFDTQVRQKDQTKAKKPPKPSRPTRAPAPPKPRKPQEVSGAQRTAQKQRRKAAGARSTILGGSGGNDARVRRRTLLGGM